MKVWKLENLQECLSLRDGCYTYFPLYMAEFLQKEDRYMLGRE